MKVDVEAALRCRPVIQLLCNVVTSVAYDQ